MNHPKIAALVFILGLDFSHNIYAQNNLKEVEKYIQTASVEWEVPGMAVAIVKDGEVIFAKGFGVLEEGKKQKVSIKLNRKSHDLVYRERYDLLPTYYIYGGLVFSPLTENYLKAWGEEWENDAPNHLMSLFDGGLPTTAGEQVIILSNVLPHNVNKGYQNLSECIISEVNGQKIQNLQSMVRTIEKITENPFVEFKTKKGIYIVLDRKAVETAQDEILQLYDVSKDRSADLNS